jgi:nitrous oxide reductase accessory protein NosL
MKNLAIFLSLVFLAALVCAGCDRHENAPKTAVKPYTLDICAVCGMKLTDMKPDIFIYQNREIKVCDKDEEAEFKKEPAKYLKTIEAAEAKKGVADSK